MVQTVSRRPPKAGAGVRAGTSPLGICYRQMALEQCYLQIYLFSAVRIFPPMLYISNLPVYTELHDVVILRRL
jgi:hypothetical protein